jgi:serine/threonine-protein kinase
MKTCPVCDTPFTDEKSLCPTDGAVLIQSRELELGHTVRGKYRIVKKIGEGGMGRVYLAEHLFLGGKLALKFLAPELSQSSRFIKRFRLEARAAYQLRHPNIVEVVDLDQDDDGTLFIAMEYVAGASLRAVLRNSNGGLPVLQALAFAREVAAGLAAAHARGIIHRDIKPDNILIAHKPGEIDRAKVLDFGIAAIAEGITEVSRTHGILLTPEYASPEQWRGTASTELDGRADLYALGGVLYEMLCGRTPFQATTSEGWMYQHLNGEFTPIASLRPEIAQDFPGLAGLVECLLARERDDRLASAEELILELDRILNTSTSDPMSIERRSATVQEPFPGTATTGQAIRQGSATPRSGFRERTTGRPPARISQAVPTGRPSVATRSPVPEPAQPTRPRARWLMIAVAAALVLAGAAAFVYLRPRPRPAASVPVFTPAPGAYSQASTVTIADSTPGAVIHFTTDGSAPSESSPAYSQPFAATAGAVRLRALAVANGYTTSAETEGLYTIAPPAPPIPAQTPAKSEPRPDLQPHPSTQAKATQPKARPEQLLSPPPQQPASPPKPQPEPVPDRLEISSSAAESMLISRTLPVYPANARSMGIGGTVVLRTTISKAGNVVNVEVMSGPAMLQQAAVDAVKTWRYRPYMAYDQPVQVTTTIELTFKMR